jgi:peptidyl-dipeptidase A
MDVKRFLAEITNQIKPLTTNINLAYWELNTVNSPSAESQYIKRKKELLSLFADAKLFQQLKQFYLADISDSVDKQQINLLYHAFLMNQIPNDLMSAIVDIENTIESTYVNFRAPLDDDTVSDNDLNELLAHSNNNAEAQRIWEASKHVGQAVAPLILKLVELRNQAAHLIGFSNFFELSLFCNELNASDLMNLLHQLAVVTDEPFDRMKAKLDQQLALKFHLSVSCLKPWHYGDPFFQEVPHTQEINTDHFFKVDLIQTATRFYQEIGLDVLPIITKSDLYERPGKSQHAFCTDIDQNGDVRILCNLRPNKYWMGTLLHELGHGIYDLNYLQELPYLLKTPAHILTTEAIAMLMGRLTSEPDWLREYLSIPESELKRLQPYLKNEIIKGELIFIRWGLVMVNFESRLYQNPSQDLNSLWWDLVAEFQKLPRPDKRNQPDWAAKIHLGTAPVYYQNYLLGECAASQINQYILKNISQTRRLMKDKRIGEYLIKKIFQPGSSCHWNQLIQNATGEKLTPTAFQSEMAQIVF